MNYTSSIVFAGGPFSPAQFDERALEECLGAIDGEGTFRMGNQLARYTYNNAKFELIIQSERVDLKAISDENLPEVLEKGFREWSGTFTPVSKVAKFTGIGLNCDLIIDAEQLNTTGDAFCKRHIMHPSAPNLLGTKEFHAVAGRYYIDFKGARYDVRIEPHFSSELKGLYTAINAHQDTKGLSDLIDKVEHISTFRRYVADFHSRLIKTGSKK